MRSPRTRLRTGKLVYLESVQGPGGEIAYFVGGKDPAHRQGFDTLQDATRWFDAIERGVQPVA